jgi:hypothetical protein
MTDTARRRELRASHRQRQPVMAVYALRVADGSPLVRSTTDLDALQNRLRFARATGITSALDLRLRQDIERLGLDALELEVLDTLEADPARTPVSTADDLATLEALWRDRLATA